MTFLILFSENDDHEVTRGHLRSQNSRKSQISKSCVILRMQTARRHLLKNI